MLAFSFFFAAVLSRRQQTYMQLARLSKETLSREIKKEFHAAKTNFGRCQLKSANSDCVVQLRLEMVSHSVWREGIITATDNSLNIHDI